jgi:hypothetical protein
MLQSADFPLNHRSTGHILDKAFDMAGKAMADTLGWWLVVGVHMGLGVTHPR